MNLFKQLGQDKSIITRRFLYIFLFLSIALPTVNGQVAKPVSIKKIDKLEVISSAARLLKSHYLYEEVGVEMGNLLLKRLESGAYDELTTTREFARALTNDLRTNFRDKHIGFTYDPKTIRIASNSSGKSPNSGIEGSIQELLKIEIYENFRLPEVKRFRGNVGYIKIDMILPPLLATGYAEKLAGAIEFIADTDALILDLRNNRGGWSEGNRLLMSYFFPPETHIMNTISRLKGVTSNSKEFTRQQVIGRRILNQPIYVLVSNRTASAAESAAHVLKYGREATLIGQSTFGAGYSFDDVFLDENFIIAMPNGVGMHPKATENWESIGVEPNIKSESHLALDKAKLLAVTELLGFELAKPKKEQYQYRVNALTWEKERLTDLKSPFVLSQEAKEEYTGKYGSRIIVIDNGSLYHKREDPKKTSYRMIPVKKDEFLIDGLENYRIYFDRNKTGEIEQFRMKSLTRLFVDKKENR